MYNERKTEPSTRRKEPMVPLEDCHQQMRTNFLIGRSLMYASNNTAFGRVSGSRR